MKRFYSFLAMAICMIVSMAQTTTVDIPLTFCIDVEDPSLLFVQDTNYQNVELVKGENVFTTVYHKTTYSDGFVYGYSDGLYIYVTTDKCNEYNIYSCDYEVGGETYPYTDSRYPTTSVYLSLDESMEGCIFHPVVETIESHRTASANVTIDGDASNVLIRFSDGYEPELVDGLNVVKFDPENESSWTIGAATYGEYLGGVTLNGNPLNESYGQYYVNVSNGDNIVIDTQASTEDVNVSFNFTNPGTEKAISGVYKYVNYSRQPISDWTEGFTTPMRTEIIVVFDVNSYNIKEFTINGQAEYVNPYYPEAFITLTSNTVLNIDAEPYTTYPVYLNLTDPEQVEIQLAQSEYSGGNTLTDLVAGNQTIEVSEQINYMIVSAAEGCAIDKVTYTLAGFSEANQVEAGYYGYTIPLSEGVQIDVVSHKVERNSEATLWINDINNVWVLYLNYSDGRAVFDTYGDVPPVTGDQTFRFNEESDNPFILFFNPTNYETPGYVEVNGVVMEPKYEGSTTYELTIYNGDIIKVYANEEEPTTGIEDVIVNGNISAKGIYDLSGRRMIDGAKLNPGIYVIDGKKVMVK